MARQLLGRFLKDEGGTTIVEFAVVSVVFFTMMCGIIEYGLILMTKIALESATEQTARTSGIDSAASTGCATRACVVQTLVAQKTMGIINPANVIVTSTVITAPTDAPPAEPDVCTAPPNNPYAPVGTCTAWLENNGVPGYQQAVSSVDPGATDDLVQISVFYTWQVMFPIMKPFFQDGIVKMYSTTVVRDEPF